jgi:hypothetical protein
VNTFLILESFPVPEKRVFVFAGEVLSGTAETGMTFEVPEAGHNWPLTVASVERVNMALGVKVALVVYERSNLPGFLGGMGVGYTTELRKLN